MNDKSKILDKIRKCLALGKSSNEHEAAAALRQAQKLMAMHRVTEDQVNDVEYVHCVVVTDYEWPERIRKVPVILSRVSNVITHALGVGLVFEPFQKGLETMFAVRYFGPRSRVFIAEHAHVVVYRAVGRAWRAYLKVNPHMKGRSGARAGFYSGWCATVVEKVERLAVSDDELSRIERLKRGHYRQGLEKAKPNVQRIYRDTLEAGLAAGSDFNINRPVGQEKLRIGRDS